MRALCSLEADRSNLELKLLVLLSDIHHSDVLDRKLVCVSGLNLEHTLPPFTVHSGALVAEDIQ